MREEEQMSKINFGNTSDASAIRAQENKRTTSDKQTQTVKNERLNEDKLKLSDRAANVVKLVDKLKDAPDVRLERVEALRDKIAAGEYKPDARDIASAILKDEK